MTQIGFEVDKNLRQIQDQKKGVPVAFAQYFFLVKFRFGDVFGDVYNKKIDFFPTMPTFLKGKLFFLYNSGF